MEFSRNMYTATIIEKKTILEISRTSNFHAAQRILLDTGPLNTLPLSMSYSPILLLRTKITLA